MPEKTRNTSNEKLAEQVKELLEHSADLQAKAKKLCERVEKLGNEVEERTKKRFSN